MTNIAIGNFVIAEPLFIIQNLRKISNFARFKIVSVSSGNYFMLQYLILSQTYIRLNISENYYQEIKFNKHNFKYFTTIINQIYNF